MSWEDSLRISLDGNSFKGTFEYAILSSSFPPSASSANLFQNCSVESLNHTNNIPVLISMPADIKKTYFHCSTVCWKWIGQIVSIVTSVYGATCNNDVYMACLVFSNPLYLLCGRQYFTGPITSTYISISQISHNEWRNESRQNAHHAT